MKTRFDVDCCELERWIEAARACCDENPGWSHQQQCSAVARMLDGRNYRSPSTNGLLAIAIVRLITHERETAQWSTSNSPHPIPSARTAT